MKKVLLATLVLSTFAAAATAGAALRGPTDGTIAVRGGAGKLRINAVGGFIGRVERGKVTITDPREGDGTGPIVSGCDPLPRFKDLETGGTIAVCAGNKLRFRLVGGRFRVTITGAGIDLSAVGRGTVTLEGDGGLDGQYSLNGEDFKSLPNFPQTFLLGAPPPPPASP